MARNPFAPPAARLHEEPENRILVPVLVALLAGIASWFAALKAMRWSYQHYWLPAAEAGRPPHPMLDTVISVGIVYALFGAAMALVRAKPWWTPWPAFLIGIVLCIFGRAWPFPRGMAFLLDVLPGHFFLTGVVASSATFLVISRYIRSRSDTSLERTHGK